MKLSLSNIVLQLFGILFSLALNSCADDEVKIDATSGLNRITEGYALGAGTKVEVWSTEELFVGLNQVYFALYDSVSGERIIESHIHVNPVMDMHTMSHSCPVLEPDEDAIGQLFPADILFTMPSGDMGHWTLEVKVHNHKNGRFGRAVFAIDVASTAPSKVVSFQAASGQRYYFSYLFPETMKVGVNDFEVVAYTFLDGEFVPAEDLGIIFSPEMPSMGHGSPNNVNPVYAGKGHYKGKANFTMTGDWRLNLELKDGEIELGTHYFDVLVK